MIQVLSTKLLTPEQQALLPEHKVQLTQYSALEIRPMPGPDSWDIEALHVFTSANAVRACFPEQAIWMERLNCCCVGPKTAALIRQRGHRVLCEASNAEALAELLIQKYSNQYIILYAGSRTLSVVPDRLKASDIPFDQVLTYQSHIQNQAFNIDFDLVLFFSPSGVKSYFDANPTGKSLAICIGNTTKNAVKKHTDKYIIAESTTVESVLQTAAQRIESYEYST